MLVEFDGSLGGLEAQLPEGFPDVWAFAHCSLVGKDAAGRELEREFTFSGPRTQRMPWP